MSLHLLATINKDVTCSRWSSVPNKDASVKSPILVSRFCCFGAYLEQSKIDSFFSNVIPLKPKMKTQQ